MSYYIILYYIISLPAIGPSWSPPRGSRCLASAVMRGLKRSSFSTGATRLGEGVRRRPAHVPCTRDTSYKNKIKSVRWEFDFD